VVFGTDSGLEASVFPRMFLVKPAVVAALIVAHPIATVVDVRPVGVAGLIPIIAMLLRSPGTAAIRLGAALRRWRRGHALRRRRRAALLMFMLSLRK